MGGRVLAGSIVLNNVGTDGSLEDIGERVASLAGLAVGGDDGNRGSAGHFGGRGLFVAVVDSKREDAKSEEFANVGGATSRLAQPEKSWRHMVIASPINLMLNRL